MSWFGTICHRFEATIPFVGVRVSPVIEWTLSVAAKRVADDRWSWAVTYPKRRVIDPADVEEDELDRMLRASAFADDVVVRCEVDQFGIVRESRVDGLDALEFDADRLRAAELELSQVGVGAISLLVPSGRLGVGAMWIDGWPSAQEDEGEIIFVLTEVDEPSFTVEKTMSVTPVDGKHGGVAGSGLVHGVAGLPLPKRSEQSLASSGTESNGLIEMSHSLRQSVVVEGG